MRVDLYADHAVTLVKAFAPRWMQDSTFEFTPSGADSGPQDKGTTRQNTSGLRNLLSSMWSHYGGFHLGYVVLCGAGLARSCSQIYQRPHLENGSLAFDLVVHIAWPPVLWLVCINSFAVPLRYAFHPPTIPNRAQLLKRDPMRRASYPHEVKDVSENYLLGSHALCYSFIILYTLALLLYLL